jgi:hypothetical protein
MVKTYNTGKAAQLPRGWTLSIETAQIEVPSFSARPNPKWKYIDAAGHDHQADSVLKSISYPTLHWVEDEVYWCPDCCDEHTNGHYECPLCKEHIVPGMAASVYSDYVPGETTIRLVGPNRKEMMLTAGEANDILTRGVEAVTELIEKRGASFYEF